MVQIARMRPNYFAVAFLVTALTSSVAFFIAAVCTVSSVLGGIADNVPNPPEPSLLVHRGIKLGTP